MKRILFILLAFTSFISVSQTSQSDALIRKAITPRTFNGLVQQGIIAQLRAMNPNIADLSTTYFCTEAGKEGSFKADFNDNSTPDDGATCIVTYNNTRLKRLFLDVIKPEFFGAKGDGVTDDTQAFQKAIDYLISKQGGKMVLSIAKYKLNSTVYINPISNACPISIEGNTEFIRDSDEPISKGSCIVREIEGDIFRVNLNISGNTVLSSSVQLFGVAFSNISFIGKTSGITCINEFRVRGTYKNLTCNSVDYLIKQNDTDNLNNSNYCDQSDFENLKVIQSRLGGLKLAYADASSIIGFYFENPRSTCNNALEIFASGGVSINNLLLGFTTNHVNIINSSLVKLRSCYGCSIKNGHIESSKFDSIIELFYCDAIKIESFHIRFHHNEIVKITNSFNTILSSINSWANLTSSHNDIVIIGDDLQNNSIETCNVNLTSYPDRNNRAVSINQGGIFKTISYKENSILFSKGLKGNGYNISQNFLNPDFIGTVNSQVFTGIRVKPNYELNGFTPITSAFLAENAPFMFWGNSGNAFEVRGTDASLKMRISAAGNMIIPNIYNSNVTGNLDFATNDFVYRYGGVARFSVLSSGEFVVGDNVASTGIADKLQVKGNIRITSLGGKILIPVGSNSPVGNATLSNGIATISTTASTTNSLVYIQPKTIIGTHAAGGYTYDVQTAGTLVITARKADGSIETGCNSIVTYSIIN